MEDNKRDVKERIRRLRTRPDRIPKLDMELVEIRVKEYLREKRERDA